MNDQATREAAPPMVIGAAFEIGETVYLKTDPENEKLLVTGITIRRGCAVYGVRGVAEEAWYYDFELTREPNF